MEACQSGLLRTLFKRTASFDELIDVDRATLTLLVNKSIFNSRDRWGPKLLPQYAEFLSRERLFFRHRSEERLKACSVPRQKALSIGDAVLHQVVAKSSEFLQSYTVLYCVCIRVFDGIG